jgi:hypothetical protein
MNQNEFEEGAKPPSRFFCFIHALVGVASAPRCAWFGGHLQAAGAHPRRQRAGQTVPCQRRLRPGHTRRQSRHRHPPRRYFAHRLPAHAPRRALGATLDVSADGVRGAGGHVTYVFCLRGIMPASGSWQPTNARSRPPSQNPKPSTRTAPISPLRLAASGLALASATARPHCDTEAAGFANAMRRRVRRFDRHVSHERAACRRPSVFSLRGLRECVCMRVRTCVCALHG